jgi:hypothetical protein
MAMLSSQDVRTALARLGELADNSGATVELLLLGGEYDVIWAAVSRFVVPGQELKAQYAFDDLWQALHGEDRTTR